MLLSRGHFYGITYTLKDFSLPCGKRTRFSFKALTPSSIFAQRLIFELLNRVPQNLDTRGTLLPLNREKRREEDIRLTLPLLSRPVP